VSTYDPIPPPPVDGGYSRETKRMRSGRVGAPSTELTRARLDAPDDARLHDPVAVAELTPIVRPRPETEPQNLLVDEFLVRRRDRDGDPVVVGREQRRDDQRDVPEPWSGRRRRSVGRIRPALLEHAYAAAREECDADVERADVAPNGEANADREGPIADGRVDLLAVLIRESDRQELDFLFLVDGELHLRRLMRTRG
jgi:hypothetical protein